MTTTQVIGLARPVRWLIARSCARGQKDRRGRSSAVKLPLRLRLMKAHVDPILSTFCRSRSWTSAQLSSDGHGHMHLGGLLALIGFLCKKNTFLSPAHDEPYWLENETSCRTTCKAYMHLHGPLWPELWERVCCNERILIVQRLRLGNFCGERIAYVVRWLYPA